MVLRWKRKDMASSFCWFYSYTKRYPFFMLVQLHTKLGLHTNIEENGLDGGCGRFACEPLLLGGAAAMCGPVRRCRG